MRRRVKVDRVLLVKCCFAAAVVVVLWALGYSFPMVAISVGAFMLIIGRVKSQNIYQRIDWELLLFFASLFVVVTDFRSRARSIIWWRDSIARSRGASRRNCLR